ncbi:hypothetical protein NPIL_97131, partial [Nephila pilipes]
MPAKRSRKICKGMSNNATERSNTDV